MVCPPSDRPSFIISTFTFIGTNPLHYQYQTPWQRITKARSATGQPTMAMLLPQPPLLHQSHQQHQVEDPSHVTAKCPKSPLSFNETFDYPTRPDLMDWTEEHYTNHPSLKKDSEEALSSFQSSSMSIHPDVLDRCRLWLWRPHHGIVPSVTQQHDPRIRNP